MRKLVIYRDAKHLQFYIKSINLSKPYLFLRLETFCICFMSSLLHITIKKKTFINRSKIATARLAWQQTVVVASTDTPVGCQTSSSLSIFRKSAA